MKSSADQLMEVGLLAGVHGLRGDLKVRPLPTGELALSVARDVYLRDAAGHLTRHRLQRCTPHKRFLLIRLEQISDLDAAKQLTGQTLLVEHAHLPELDEGQYLWGDLEGRAVRDRRLGLLGDVREMFATAAHDILVVRDDRREVLIPAIPRFVLGIDEDTGELLVDLPDGLVPDRDEI